MIVQMNKKTNSFILLVAALSGQTDAFAPSIPVSRVLTAQSAMAGTAEPLEYAQAKSAFFAEQIQQTSLSNENKSLPSSKKMAISKKKGRAHEEGIFSPVVKLTKKLIGNENLSKVRGKAIGAHSDVIANFVATSRSSTGTAVLETLFSISDKNNDGLVDEQELKESLNKLGFDWIEDKQAKKILERAAGDEGKAFITKDQFLIEAPRTLKVNLTKLAKKNGGRLGFLV